MIPTKYRRQILPLFLSIGMIQMFSSSKTFAAGDDFSDNAKDPAKWGNDIVSGNGVLTEKNQRLEYTCAAPSLGDDDVDRPWVLTRFPYNADWEIQIDTFNITSPSLAFQVNSFGFQILSPLSAQNNINVELYSSALGGGPARNGFDTNLDTNDVTVATSDTGGLSVTNGAVRMVFTAATKIITVFYDLDISDGYQWVQYGDFGLAGAGGIDGNTDWGLSDTDQFSALVYGFSQGMSITSGQMSGDNFLDTGGIVVGPGAPPSPLPTGNFGFAFPTNNPFLTAIIFGAGNYRGLISTILSSNRVYNVDVAQDESGKLMMMGTVDGITDTNGNSELSGSGAVMTVNEKPAAHLAEIFAGTVDALGTTYNGTQVVPLETVDVGGGAQGFAGTVSDQGTVSGVPFSAANEPFQVAAPIEGLDNLKKAWSLQLEIKDGKKGKANGKAKGKGQDITVASAQLVLPNGDTIVYRDRPLKKYSAKKGHSLTFENGTNVTMQPPAIDRHSSITIKGLKFVLEGNVWKPAAGIITYEFLGQKGTANLLDFVSP
jgi:hypothetical protein